MDSRIYRNVAKLAEEKGLTIMAIEKKAGLANGTIGGWRKSIPKVSSLEAVARILKVTVNRLLEEQSDAEN